jgi:hypothetical protein
MRVWEWRRRFCVVHRVHSALSKRAGHTLAPDRDGRAVAERLMQISTRATGSASLPTAAPKAISSSLAWL